MIRAQLIIRCSCYCEKCSFDGSGTEQTGATVTILPDGRIDMGSMYIHGAPGGGDWILTPSGYTLCPKCQERGHRSYWCAEEKNDT